MKQKKIDFVKLLKPYKEGWVGISDDFKRVISHGKTLKEITKKGKGHKQKVYYFPAGKNYSHFVGISQ